MTARCENCVWWHRQGATIAKAKRDPSAYSDTGTCHLYAPTIVRTLLGPESFFPVTHASRFCGDFEPITSPEPDDGEEIDTDNVVLMRPAA